MRLSDLLSQHYLFSDLNESERAKLINDSVQQHFGADTLIFQKGYPAHYFYLVLEGAVRIYFATPEGREKTIRIFTAPNTFAEAVTFMPNDLYPANAATLSDCTLLAIRVETYKKLLADRPALYCAIIARMMHYIQMLTQQLEMLSVMDSKSRLLKYISQHLPPAWRNGGTYGLPMNKKDLAEYLAMRPETLSRTLKNIERDGTLIWGKEGVTLLSWPPNDENIA